MTTSQDNSDASPIPPARVTPPGGVRTFMQVLVNTAVANVTTSYLWFALTFWVYLETQVGARDRHHRRRLHAAGRGVLDAVRHDRRPASQAPRHGVRRVGDAGGVPDRRRAVPALPGVGAPRPRRSVVLDLLGHHPVRRGRREPAEHRAVDDRDAARARRTPRQRQRPGRHRPGPRVHGHERVQRARDRPARDGVDAR